MDVISQNSFVLRLVIILVITSILVKSSDNSVFALLNSLLQERRCYKLCRL